jgi:tetratricopeptide (TPR) repeat protein
MNIKYIIAGCIIAVLLIGGYIYTQSNTQTKIDNELFSINTVDKIESWNFNGLYSSNPALMEKAQKTIDETKPLVEAEQYTPYQINIEISNQYAFMGDGENAYKYLIEALKLDSDTTGLAYHNMGNLMVHLGAYQTARDAYKKSFEVQPVQFYKDAYDAFMVEYFPDEIVEDITTEDPVQN